MNTRKLLSGAAALALLCSAGGCGQNESEQTHAEVQQNSGTSDISTTDAPVSTEPAGTTGRHTWNNACRDNGYIICCHNGCFHNVRSRYPTPILHDHKSTCFIM